MQGSYLKEITNDHHFNLHAGFNLQIFHRSKSSSSHASESRIKNLSKSSNSHASERVVLEICQSLVIVMQVTESY